MSPFWTSCTRADYSCGTAALTVLTLPALDRAAKTAVAARCKEHYVGRKWLEVFGRRELAERLATVLPVSKRQRSGDLGEILATEYVNRNEWGYEVPVLRLRWKDGRELPMRGEDAVAFNLKLKPIGLLKVESKSRAVLTDAVITSARAGLNKNKGRPSAFVVAFIVERLLDDGKVPLARTIEEQTAGARLLDSRELVHLLFVFCGNEPTTLLSTHLTALRSGKVRQFAVAIHCNQHQAMIRAIYEEASRV